MKPFFLSLVEAAFLKVGRQSNKDMSQKPQSKSEQALRDNREILEDIMLSQLKIAKVYNDCCSCCVDDNLRNDMLNIIKENYDTYNNELNEAKKRGWIVEHPVDSSRIDTIKAKFEPTF